MFYDKMSSRQSLYYRLNSSVRKDNYVSHNCLAKCGSEINFPPRPDQRYYILLWSEVSAIVAYDNKILKEVFC